ncbi:Ethanolaminephosphotransferase 1 [Acropora cervicornis]|uniref:Ethanolaminephosphotransferase 1 n=1 Tax=Acropora cervicornis TaxID=6130 RepID=A0AAD9QJ95_ACRCE|nr:Ethanolaminephosphotransferase 1 [Acropora cervicornis]
MPPESKDLSSVKDKTSSFNRLHTAESKRSKGMYLTPEELRGFDKYKYKSEDTSPVSKYITHPFWNFVVQLTPLMVVMANKLVEPTAGELFDHGLDSSAAFLIPMSLFSLFGHGPGIVSLLELYHIMLACLLGFFVAHWEKYNTGSLFLPWTYDASQLAIVLVYLLTYFFGVDLWKIQLMPGFPCCHVFRWTVYFTSVIVTVAMAVYNMYQARISKTDRGLTFYEGCRPMLSFGGLVALFYTWLLLSPAGILELQPRMFFTATGIVFSNITCRLIVSTMSGQRCQPFNVMLLPVCAIILIVPFVQSAQVEVAILALYTAGVAVFHVHYGVFVVRELCDHLHINCFSIKKP